MLIRSPDGLLLLLVAFAVPAANANNNFFRFVSHADYDKGQFYPNRYHCEFVIELGAGCDEMSIKCDSTDIRGAYRRGCARADYLMFDDGKNIQKKKYCGRFRPAIKSHSGKMHVLFKTNGRSSGRGFDCSAMCSKRNKKKSSGNSNGQKRDAKKCACGLSIVHAQRIVGGNETGVNEFPWVAGIVRTGEDKPWCGATLVGSHHVLTAGHCMQSETNKTVEVLLGEHDYTTQEETAELRAKVQSISIHPSFNIETLDFDFALIKLAKRVKFAKMRHIRPVCLPKKEAARPKDGETVFVSGWGFTSEYGEQSKTLQKARINVINKKNCSEMLFGEVLSERMFCAGRLEGKVDSCQGDSGGSMVHMRRGRFELVGVTSWGFGCAQENSPGVYANPAAVLPWIVKTLGSYRGCPKRKKKPAPNGGRSLKPEAIL